MPPPSSTFSLLFFILCLLHSVSSLRLPLLSLSCSSTQHGRPPPPIYSSPRTRFGPGRTGRRRDEEKREREREDGRIIISKSLQIFTQKAYRVSCGGSEVRAHLPSYRFQLIASRRLRLAPCKTPRVRSRVFARGYVCTRPPTGNDHYRAVVGMMVRERAGVSTETSNFRGKERMTVTDARVHCGVRCEDAAKRRRKTKRKRRRRM